MTDADPDEACEEPETGKLWERWLRGDLALAPGEPRSSPTARLPMVLPVVLHHSETGWTAVRRLADLVDLDDDERALLGRWVPDFEYVLDDVSRASDDDLMGRDMPPAAALALWCLRDARRLDEAGFERAVARWRNVLARAAEGPRGAEALESLFCYYSAVGEVPPERIARALRDRVGGRAEEAFVTTADMLRQEGKALGISEGKALGEALGISEGKALGISEGEAEALCAVLTARGLALTDADRERIGGCRDLAVLHRWLVRAATATSLEGVFAEG